MKSLALAAAAAIALAAAPTVSAQAFSNPTGYVTETLRAGQFNLIGLTVHQSVEVAGTFDTVSGTTLTSAGAFAGLQAGSTYILEITSGAAEGAVQEITTFNANSITTPDDLSGQLTNSDSYTLRRASTLSDVFGESNEAGLQEGASATVADTILVPDDSGQFDQFFYSNGGFFGTGWRQDGQGATDMSNAVLFQTDAFFVFRRGAEMDLVISGAVKTTDTSFALSGEFSYLSGVYPVGSTLGSSGLEGTLQAGPSATTADAILIFNGTSFDQYYFSNGGFFGTGWRLDGAGSADQSGVEIPSGIIVRRLSSTTSTAGINVPPAWSL